MPCSYSQYIFKRLALIDHLLLHVDSLPTMLSWPGRNTRLSLRPNLRSRNVLQTGPRSKFCTKRQGPIQRIDSSKKLRIKLPTIYTTYEWASAGWLCVAPSFGLWDLDPDRHPLCSCLGRRFGCKPPRVSKLPRRAGQHPARSAPPAEKNVRVKRLVMWESH